MLIYSSTLACKYNYSMVLYPPSLLMAQCSKQFDTRFLPIILSTCYNQHQRTQNLKVNPPQITVDLSSIKNHFVIHLSSLALSFKVKLLLSFPFKITLQHSIANCTTSTLCCQHQLATLCLRGRHDQDWLNISTRYPLACVLNFIYSSHAH